MNRVLVVEADEALRETIELVLEDAGIAAGGVRDAAVARVALAVSESPLVVIVDEWSDAVIAARDDLPQHAYVLLSSQPERVPQTFNRWTGRAIPVLGLPFSIDDLISLVREACAMVQTCQVPARVE